MYTCHEGSDDWLQQTDISVIRAVYRQAGVDNVMKDVMIGYSIYQWDGDGVWAGCV